jgi:hypothetical protein
MPLWYRVFGRDNTEVQPGDLLAHLAAAGGDVTSAFAPSGHEWRAAEFRFATTTPIHLERFRADEEGIRAELNSWAAFLETCDYEPNHAALMERVIQTQQLFTLRKPIDCVDETLAERLCVDTCRFLSERTDGVWQADDEGFFAADGTLLLKEY